MCFEPRENNKRRGLEYSGNIENGIKLFSIHLLTSKSLLIHLFAPKYLSYPSLNLKFASYITILNLNYFNIFINARRSTISYNLTY